MVEVLGNVVEREAVTIAERTIILGCTITDVSIGVRTILDLALATTAIVAAGRMNAARECVQFVRRLRRLTLRYSLCYKVTGVDVVDG